VAGIRLGTRRGRGLVAAASLGSGMAFLDATVVNVALPTIGRDLDADLAALQWTVNAYTLTLAALILLGGALGDRLGRRRVFVTGALWFAAASALCALAPTVELLIAARALQGIGAALLTPGSLAMIQASVDERDRGRAIGAWSGLTGVAAVLGPLLGGWLIELDWRWVFGINLPLAATAVVLAARCAPESRDPLAPSRLDVAGAVLGALGLGALTYALVVAAQAPGDAVVPVLVAAVCAAAFVWREHTATAPMVPPELFADRVFTVTNLLTLAVYAALSGVLFLLVIQLEVSLGWTPLQAGLSTLPSTLLMTTLSARSGALAQRTGPRLPLTAGPCTVAAGVALLAQVGPGDDYLTDVLPGVLLFGAGLTLLVAPLTSTVLAAAPQRLAGTASGVNNAVARTAGLLAVAGLPLVAGLSGRAYTDPALLTPAYRVAMTVCAALLLAGGAIGALGLRRRPQVLPAPVRATPVPTAPCASCGGAPALDPPIHGAGAVRP
jgi:EmrB/QacA subfamily drug resistance transporter